MDIRYENKKLEELIKDEKTLCRTVGQRRATILLRRLDDMSAAVDIKDLQYLPGHFHELTGDRKGEWACSLDQPYRLVFEIEDNSLLIKEIVNYHGK